MYTTATIGDILPAGTLSIDRNGDTVTSSATTDAVINFLDNADTFMVLVHLDYVELLTSMLQINQLHSQKPVQTLVCLSIGMKV